MYVYMKLTMLVQSYPIGQKGWPG